MSVTNLYNPEYEFFKSVEIGLKNGDINIKSRHIIQHVSTSGYPYLQSVFTLNNGVDIEMYYLPNFTYMDIQGQNGFFTTEDIATINRILISLGKILTESSQ